MSEQPNSIPDDRPLTEQERRLALWMLEHGLPQAIRFVEQLRQARVISRCACGCASINFVVEGSAKPQGEMQILADFLFGEDDKLCGAFIFEQGGILSGLEVCGYAVDAPRILPNPEDLRPLLSEYEET
jgi:hypothetical protein